MKGRGALRTGGAILAILALGWIGWRFARSGAFELLQTTPAGLRRLAVALIVGCAIYASAVGLLATGWWRMMIALSTLRPTAFDAVSAYCFSQYGKYLPGNVAHYALRHAWSRKYGISHAGMGFTSILEAVILVLVSGMILLASKNNIVLPHFLDRRIALLILVSLPVFLVCALIIARRTGIRDRVRLPDIPKLSVLMTVAACHFGFFVLCATTYEAIGHIIGIDTASFTLLLGASSASWLVGFAVIGAPAGVGAREAMFVVLAGGALGESHALLLTGLFRIATFLGDTVCFAVGTCIQRVTRASSELPRTL